MRLREFYQDKEMKDDLHKYFTTFLELKAIEMVYDRQDTSAIAQAKDILDGVWEQLDAEFAPKPKKRDLDNAK